MSGQVFHHWMIIVKTSSLRQHPKKKDWYNTQLLCLNQHDLNPQILFLTPSLVSSFPFPHGTSLPSSQQSSHQPTRKCHHLSRENSRFKHWPSSVHQQTSTPMVRFEIESRTAVPAWLSSVKMTSPMSGMLPQAPTLAPSRHRGRLQRSQPIAILCLIMGLSYHHLGLQC